MRVDGLRVAASGLEAAHVRMRNSAHDVANLVTDGFRPHETRNVEQAGGGVEAQTLVAPEPRDVSIAHELVDQMLAVVQARASARVFAAEVETRGALLDIKA
jgi:flagellar basal body rod protein FlgG